MDNLQEIDLWTPAPSEAAPTPFIKNMHEMLKFSGFYSPGLTCPLAYDPATAIGPLACPSHSTQGGGSGDQIKKIF